MTAGLAFPTLLLGFAYTTTLAMAYVVLFATGMAMITFNSLSNGVLQLLVAIYGGYFGAGIGILMLAVLGVLGLGDIHRLNAVKNVLATAINGTAAALFAAGSFFGSHDVSWGHAAIMAVAAVLGSFAGASVVRRLPAPFVRRCVALIGFALAAYYFRPS
jgi:uncharacterized membrane protein YfcA